MFRLNDKKHINWFSSEKSHTNISILSQFVNSGHAYDVNISQELEEIIQSDHANLVSFLDMLKVKLCSSMPPNKASLIVSSLDISVGSTPSALKHPKNAVFDTISNNIEIHPGNYVFYDRQQLWAGSCSSENDIAVRVMTRVISHYTDRNAIMLDAGALALTKDSSPQGGVCSLDGYPNLECYRMSQEVIMAQPKNDKDSFPFEEFPSNQ